MRSILSLALDVPLSKIFSYQHNTSLKKGTRVAVSFGRTNRQVVGFVIDCDPVDSGRMPSSTALKKLKPIIEVFDEILNQEILQLIEFASQYYCYPIGQTIFTAIPAKFKKPKKIVSKTARTKQNPKNLNDDSNKNVQLTEEQRSVFDSVNKHLGVYYPCVLNGITGSGKTEIYLKLIEQVLKRKQQALVLVPEINLTPQLVARFKERFLDASIAILTSHTTVAKRTSDYLKSETGEVDIIIGTRLSIFTPVKNLGIVVVDEEHDSSFKQNDGLHYNARDLAVWRARYWQIPIILGSATISLETFYNCKNHKYNLFELKTRGVKKAILPKVNLVNLTHQIPQDGLTKTALAAIEKRLKLKEISLIFINRRGYAPTISCYDCGWVGRCSNCSTNMVFHLNTKTLKCHHCGKTKYVPDACPSCGSQHLHTLGVGSQKIEESLQQKFPHAQICRIDQDSMSHKSAWNDLYDKVNEGSVDILVGTQMLAKGHDFHDITLVVGVNIDSSLYSYDFRASELLFTQLTQVSGRAGRGSKPGEVIIQTNFPKHPLFKFLIKHDFNGFAKHTLLERKELNLPPYACYAIFRANGNKMSRVLEYLSHIVGIVSNLTDGVIVYPPVPSVMQRLKNKDRAQVLIQAVKREELHKFLLKLTTITEQVKPKFGIKISIDVDPLEV